MGHHGLVRVLIVGGGIGGLTAAAVLRRRGADVSVFEQAPRLRVEGSGLTLWANGTAALSRLGLRDDVDAVTAPFDGVRLMTADGRTLSSTDLGGAAARYGSPHVNVHRGELLGALSRAAGDVVATGRRYVAYRRDGQGVLVEFADGQTAHGDVLVGADGAGSTLRSQLPADAARERGSRFWSGWQGIVSELPSGFPAASMLVVVGSPTFAGLYSLPAGRLGWFVDRRGRAAPPPGTGSTDALLRWLDGWPAVVREAISATPPETMRYDTIRDHLPGRQWAEGPVTLLGDAAHAMLPTLGQGASQAIEDAAALADALTATTDTPVEALRRYEARRAGQTSSQVRGARVMITLRNLAPALGAPLIRLLPAKSIERRLSTRYM